MNGVRRLKRMAELGLFPLGIVLFPESAYPLHIFEERYKLLINNCIKNDVEFGICYLNSKGMSHIGCSAVVSDVIKKYPDGRMDILIAGVKRFRILNFSDGKTPYYSATIEYFEDDDNEYDLIKLYECTDLFNQIADNIKSVKVDPIIVEELKVTKPSFFISQKSGMSPEQRQAILEMRNENQRLIYIIRHLKRLFPVVKEAEFISEMIKNDGYLKPGQFKF